MALPVLATNNNQEIDTSPIAEAMGTALSVMEPSKAITQSNMNTAQPITIEGEWEVIGEDVSDAIREIGLDGELIAALEDHATKVADINESYLSKINSGIENLTSITITGHDALLQSQREMVDAIKENNLEQTEQHYEQLENIAEEDNDAIKAIEDNTKATADAVKEGAEDVNPALSDDATNEQITTGSEVAEAIKDGKKELGGIGTALAVAVGVLKGLVIGSINYLKMLGRGIKNIFAKIIPQGVKNFGARIMTGIRSFGTSIVTSIKSFGTMIATMFTESKLGKGIIKGIDKVKKFFSVIGGFFTKIGKFFAPILSLLNGITGTTSKVGGFFSKISGFMSKFMGIVSKVATVVSKAFLPLTVIMALFKGITASFDKFAEGDFLGGIGAFLDGIFKFLVIDLLDILYDVVMFIPKMILRAVGLDNIADMFDDFSFAGLWDGFKNGFMDFFRVTLPNMLDGALARIGIPAFGFGPIKAFGKTIIPRFDFDGYFPFKEGAEARIKSRNDAKAERDEAKTKEAQALADKESEDATKESTKETTVITETAEGETKQATTNAEKIEPQTVQVQLDKESASDLGLPQNFQMTAKDGSGRRTIITEDGNTIRIGRTSPIAPVMDAIYEGTVAQAEDVTGGPAKTGADATSQTVDFSEKPTSGEGIATRTGDVNDSTVNNQNTTNVVTNMSPVTQSSQVNNVKNSTGIIYDGGASSLGGRSALLPN